MAAPSISSSSPVTHFSGSPSDNNSINALIDNVKWGNSGIGTGATVYYSFPTSNSAQLWSRIYRADTSSELYDGFTAASAAQINAARQSFEAWSNVTNLDFIEVANESFSSVGDIRIANSGTLGSNTYAYAYFPALNNPVGGDVWFNTAQPISTGNDYSAGDNGFQTMMHEIGHALGIDHPFDGDAQLSSTLDHYQYSIMSYSDVANGSDYGRSTFYPTTPMLLDVLAIQYLYGANTEYNTGNNTYSYGDGYAYETIWDAGGIDTLEFTGSLDGVINLNAGTFSSLGASVKAHRGVSNTSQENIAIAYNVTIENAVGGTGNDTIYGNQSANTIDGGAGIDTYVTDLSQSELSSVIRSGSTIRMTGNQVTDTLTNIEYVTLNNGTFAIEDLITGESSSDTQDTNDSNTTTPSFSSSVNGTTVTTSPEAYNGPVDYLEYQLIGSSSNEAVIGADTNDFINLLGGDDAAAGGGGNDVLDGGTGSNFLTGNSGADTFFLDGRGGSTTWSTITDFDGDSLNIWGWIDGTSQVVIQQIDGAEGFKGHTLHIDLNGDNLIDTSITFSGLTSEQTANAQALEVAGNGYLFIG